MREREREREREKERERDRREKNMAKKRGDFKKGLVNYYIHRI